MEVADTGVSHLSSLRATRWFTEEPVRDEQLHQVLEAGRWAGSARNRQPWRFVVVRNHDVRASLSRLGAYAAHLASAPVVIAIGVDEAAGGEDAQFDAGRAAQNMMLAAHSLRLGSCPVSFFPAANVDHATELCRLAPPWHVRTAISLGHPAPTPGGRSAIPVGRLPMSELVTEIR
ncbi:nitroreductase [Amycolatopsis rubida]|uniref:Nitroreductase n=1 Tax=Amycolatopsis rubida TaxID=112413 RepID=A0ABX0C0E0_9PSEU|nr:MULTISPECIES: nitroreductase family protein [Amycolatopsis]MYW96150.1 nitroreductase [Amycolatopsis rubida]NEC61141.1 nitroreductase [Amycolatopsis rubida]OAP23335.1 NADPH-flavin oxidoreductase [Amycolatopsis sp. M39]